MKRLLLVVLLLALGCDQKDDGQADAAAAALSAILPPLPTTSPSPLPSLAPAPLASAHRDAGTGCGDAGTSDCPLQAWMRANMYPRMRVQDWQGIADSLERCSKLAPRSGYPNWVSISIDGANAARAADMEAVKAACRGCHEQYKDKYRAELRSRPIP